MSDIKQRRLLRKYLAEPTGEHAIAFITEYLRAGNTPDYDGSDIEDMEVANLHVGWINELPGEGEEVFTWIESNACFTHTDPHTYENIVYIGILDNEGFTADHFRDDPTPVELIDHIQEAHDKGFAYICFYI